MTSDNKAMSEEEQKKHASKNNKASHERDNTSNFDSESKSEEM